VNKTYYDYLKKINREDDITFEQFYSFYRGAIKHAKRKNLDLEKVLISENFYKNYVKKSYIYNEADLIKNAIDKTKEVVGNVTNQLYKKVSSMSITVSNFLNQIKVSPAEATKDFLMIIFNFVTSKLSAITKAIVNTNNIKNKIVEYIKNIVIDLITKVLNIPYKLGMLDDEIKKQEVIDKIREKGKQISDYFDKNPKQRIAIGVLLAAGIIYTWTNSAFTGNPFTDFNVEVYSDLMSTKSLVSFLSLEYLTEVFTFFIIGQMNALQSFLPAWFSVATNISIVGGLLLLAFFLKAVNKSDNPNVTKFKKKMCSFLSSPPENATGKIKSNISNIFMNIGKGAGIISGENLAASCSI
jgi:hypothetical protein